jgi:hypothetical protein
MSSPRPTSTHPTTLALIAAFAAAAILSVGCGASTLALPPELHGCEADVLGQKATIQPESSGLSCRRIRSYFAGVPADPGPFLMSPAGNDPPTWRCVIHGDVPTGTTILGCHIGRREFAYVATD